MAKATVNSQPKIAQPVFPIFPLPPFVSQAELVNVLRLRAYLNTITMQLEEAQDTIVSKLDREASVELGPFTCASVNANLAIWEDIEFTDGHPEERPLDRITQRR